MPAVIRYQVEHKDPESPRQQNSAIPTELEAICLKCMEKEKHLRYATSSLLAQDLQNYLESRPIQARPITPSVRLRKFISRNRTLTAATLTVFLTLLLGLLFSTIQWQKAEEARQNEAQERAKAQKMQALAEEQKAQAEQEKQRAEQEKQRAEQEKQRAEQEKRKAQEKFGYALIERARRYRKDNQLFEAKMCYARAIGFMGFGGSVAEYPSLIPEESEEWVEANRILLSKPDITPIWRSPCVQHHDDTVTSVAFSSDGKTLASGGRDKTIRLWNVNTKELIATLQGHSEEVTSVAFSTDGKTLASGSWDKTIRLWNVDTKQLIATLQGHSDCVRSVAFSPDGKTLASGSWDKAIRLWDVNTKQQIAILQGHSEEVTSVAFSTDGKTLASGSANVTISGDKPIRLWNVRAKQEIATLQGHSEEVTSVAFSTDGKTLAFGGGGKTIRLWNLEYPNYAICLPMMEWKRLDVVFREGERSLLGSPAILCDPGK